MDTAQLTTFFRTRLGVSLPPMQVDAFSEDLLRANLALMDAALQQVAATARSTGRPPRDARRAVWSEYHRRIAEIHHLFPLFFTFESAWRAVTAEVLKAIYGGTDSWWHPVRTAMDANIPVNQLTHLGGITARTEVIRRVEHILRVQPAYIRQSILNSYDFIEIGTLGDVGWLIDRHWSAVSSLFNNNSHSRLTSSHFNALFKRVREARNDAYHHRIVSNRQKVVDAAEQLLDLINIHLESHVQAITASAPSQFHFSIRLARYHI